MQLGNLAVDLDVLLLDACDSWGRTTVGKAITFRAEAGQTYSPLTMDPNQNCSRFDCFQACDATAAGQQRRVANRNRGSVPPSRLG